MISILLLISSIFPSTSIDSLSYSVWRSLQCSVISETLLLISSISSFLDFLSFLSVLKFASASACSFVRASNSLWEEANSNLLWHSWDLAKASSYWMERDFSLSIAASNCALRSSSAALALFSSAVSLPSFSGIISFCFSWSSFSVIFSWSLIRQSSFVLFSAIYNILLPKIHVNGFFYLYLL